MISRTIWMAMTLAKKDEATIPVGVGRIFSVPMACLYMWKLQGRDPRILEVPSET